MVDAFRALSRDEATASEELAKVASAAAVGSLSRVAAADGEDALMAARAAELPRAEILARSLMLNALWTGYRDDVTVRAGIVAGKALAVTITDADRSALVDFPIQGHTAAAVAAHLRALLTYGLDGGDIAADEVRKHGERVGGAVREAYFAGVKASTVAIGRALTGG